MVSFEVELENIKKQIVENYEPEEIILFGSVAKGIFKANSDIDLCIIKDTNDKSSFAYIINSTGVKIYG